MSDFYKTFVTTVNEIVDGMMETQGENIKKAGEIIAQSIMAGGIIQAFGSGHSYGCAIEICGRAGGLIPTKAIKEPSSGIYEMVEGVGAQFCKKLDIEEHDCFIMISNSGRNPLGLEMADFIKKKGLPLIVVTSLEVSKGMTSRHSSGKRLFEFADVVLDNCGVYGDAAIEIPGFPEKVMGTSSITSNILLDCSVLHAIKLMVDGGFNPPVYRSANIDGGPEYNDKIVAKYGYRLGTF